MPTISSPKKAIGSTAEPYDVILGARMKQYSPVKLSNVTVA